jgi:LruC domain-containing protein
MGNPSPKWANLTNILQSKQLDIRHINTRNTFYSLKILNKLLMMKKVILSALIGMAFLVSCNKDKSAASASYRNIESTSDINSPMGFDWKTTRTVSLDISSLAENSKGKQIIKVSDIKGNLIVSRVMKVNSQSKVFFELSKAYKSVIVSLNGVDQELNIGSGTSAALRAKKGGGTVFNGCDCNGRMQNFTVVYNGTSTTSFHLRKKGPKQSYPLVYSINNVNPGDTVTFNGFDVNGNSNKPARLLSQSHVEINGVTYNIHTSCSIDIMGMTFGPITVIAYTDGDGAYCGPVAPPKCVDSDGDGCCDKDDAFPNDPSKCDIQYNPGKNIYGSYAWEDLWPATGDYDFNDKIINRNTALVLNQNGDVIEAVHKLILVAAGASYANGLGFSMPGVPPTDVASVTGTLPSSAPYTIIESNGTEAGQSNAVVIVYENWKEHVTYTTAGAFFNTLKNSTLSEGRGYSDTITITVNFAVAQPVSKVLEIDPFLIRDGVRGSEIHLPWYGPTDLANLTLFNTRKDASAYPNTGNNYVSEGNIPWAIQTPLAAFEWPIEKTDIVTVYHDFAQWALTGSPANWYSNGNRNLAKIY